MRYTAAIPTSDAEIIVLNEPGITLLSTGGSGTVLYTVGGLSLVTLVAMMLWLEGGKKRRGVSRR